MMSRGIAQRFDHLSFWQIGMPTVPITIFLCCIVTMANSSPTPVQKNRDSDETLIRICGRELISVLKGLCKNCIGGSSVEPPVKKSNGEWYDDVESVLPFRVRRRLSVGIATECCDRQCSYGYLKSFCLPLDECRRAYG